MEVQYTIAELNRELFSYTFQLDVAYATKNNRNNSHIIIDNLDHETGFSLKKTFYA